MRALRERFDLYPREARPVNGLSTPSLLIDSDPESDKFISRLTAALSLGNSREQSHGVLPRIFIRFSPIRS
jgi:hypothetical protein